MKLEIVEKAYMFNNSEIEQPWFYEDIIEYVETRGKAKMKIWRHLDDEIRNVDGKEITFLNLPVKRCKNQDRVLYKGEIVKRYQTAHYQAVEKNDNLLDSYMKDTSITHCYKMKRGQYYAWNNCGYVSYKHVAGVYPKEEAIPYCKGQLEVICVPINTEEHNEIILNQIARLKKGLIN